MFATPKAPGRVESLNRKKVRCDLIVLSRRALNQLRVENPELFAILSMNMASKLARKLQYTDEMLLRQQPDRAR